MLVNEEFEGQNRGEATMDSGKSDTICVDHRKDEELEGFIDLWKLMFGFMYSLGLRWAVELGIPDIIAKGGPESMLSAEEIAGFLPSPSPNIDFLSRTLSFLATRGIFSQTLQPNSPIKYGLTPISKWLINDTDNGGAKAGTFAPFLLLHTHEAVISPWYRLGESILSGSGFPFELVHGKLLFSLAESNPELGRLFNEAMGTYSKILVKDILAAYGDEFRKLEFRSLVDVGGGNGSIISVISRSFPNIKCCNFDLPEVISEAPSCAGVQHIAGDMFVSVPNADAIFMKGILHDWGDEECKKILKNCHQALSKQGKLIMVEMVLAEAGQSKSSWSEEIGGIRDMIMLSHQRGKERREEEWRKLLQSSGFNHYNIISLPSEPLQMSIIEAFPAHVED
ncbi:hypothetical protein SUGI_0183680 [Cryptomeria japonica]|uniref:(R,S)-reticuline 7-O-methyltransferase n=1 Tax=Cryptomeria japonica TaxID=3369 RepID=UPI002408A921|nr:(R,S)-reticuline 7-O-methyltransferase [Cryptomeria japonica]GLJ12082.1 hypothetical protein SUGI_0183680 [Cryptomeria japonica]